MATDLIKNNINYFLTNFLGRPASAIPKGAQWIVSFETREKSLFNTIFPAIELAYSYEPVAKDWNTKEAARVILSKEYQETRGCLFCQALALPGESITVAAEGNIQSNAYIRSYVGQGREAFSVMRMSFLDTNISFVDSFLRGWALATANFGMFAEPKTINGGKPNPRNYRTDMICYKFGTTSVNEPPFIIQQMSFKDICCVGVSEEEYNYDSASRPILREARFVYNSYSVNTVDALPNKMYSNMSNSVDNSNLRGGNITNSFNGGMVAAQQGF